MPFQSISKHLGCPGLLAVFAQDAQYTALNGYLGGWNVDWLHFHIGWLQSNDAAFGVKALQCGLGTVNQSNHDFALTGGTGSFYQHVIPADDVFVAHGIAPYLECEDIAIADYIVQRDAIGEFGGLDWEACGDLAGQWKTIAGAGSRAWRQDVDRAAAIVDAIQQPFFFQIGNVLVDGCQAFEPHAPGNLLERRGVPVASHK